MAIARDSGASYPLITGGAGAVSTAQVNGVVTNAADTYIVVRVAWGQGAATVTQPVAVTWVGGAPAGCSNFECWAASAYTVASTGATGTSIWVAKATQAISSSKSVLVTAAASATVAYSVAVDAITGSDGPGAWIGIASNNGSSINRFATFADSSSDIREGSWVFVAGAGDNPGGVTPQTNTTEDDERIDGTNNAIAAVGLDSTGTKRSASVGWTGAQAWFSVAALEMRASGLASVGPFTSGRSPLSVWTPGLWARGLDGGLATSPGNGAGKQPIVDIAASYVFPATGPVSVAVPAVAGTGAAATPGTTIGVASAAGTGTPAQPGLGSGLFVSGTGTAALAGALVGLPSVSGTFTAADPGVTVGGASLEVPAVAGTFTVAAPGELNGALAVSATGSVVVGGSTSGLASVAGSLAASVGVGTGEPYVAGTGAVAAPAFKSGLGPLALVLIGYAPGVSGGAPVSMPPFWMSTRPRLGPAEPLWRRYARGRRVG